ncbi:MAG: hypothetical protein JWP57_713 [Spirosoma sp.]|nr:hypothetical protein [Spirosoma sp.]
MDGAKKVMDQLTVISVSSSAITAAATYYVGGKVELLIPIISGLIGTATVIVRVLLAHFITASIIRNPLNTELTQKVTQPEPLKDMDYAQPKNPIQATAQSSPPTPPEQMPTGNTIPADAEDHGLDHLS